MKRAASDGCCGDDAAFQEPIIVKPRIFPQKSGSSSKSLACGWLAGRFASAIPPGAGRCLAAKHRSIHTIVSTGGCEGRLAWGEGWGERFWERRFRKVGCVRYNPRRAAIERERRRVLPPQRFSLMHAELRDSAVPRRVRLVCAAVVSVLLWWVVGVGWVEAGIDDLPPQPRGITAGESAGAVDVGVVDEEGVAAADAGWVWLFDGQTLDGWVRRGGEARFEIREGELVGVTVVGQPNSFLCTVADYSDFELELEFRVDDPRLNSGVQVRSQSLPQYQNGRVHGYQVEIDPSDRGWTGGIYEEGRRGWLQDLKNNPQARSAFVLGQWNRMRVRCQGDRIQSWVNEIATADLVDDMTSSGFIGLQVHATRLSDPMEVRWRNIRLRQIERDAP